MKFHARSLFRFSVSFFLSFQLEYYIPRIGGISCLDSCTIERAFEKKKKRRERKKKEKECRSSIV